MIGPDTLDALNRGPADRARRLAVGLERLRWAERTPPPTRIDVNTAATFLDYWRDGQHAVRYRVVTGEPGWETPQLGSPIFQLVAHPYWRVPDSIFEDELAEKGPAYFAEQNMEFRDGKLVQLPGPKERARRGQVRHAERQCDLPSRHAQQGASERGGEAVQRRLRAAGGCGAAGHVALWKAARVEKRGD